VNPLSAFSFGKVIKTFIPGLLATVGVVLALELIYRMSLSTPCPPRSGFWSCFFGGALLRRFIADTGRTTAFGALLIPAALLLGFFLNTVMWFGINNRCRARVEKKMGDKFTLARASLEDEAELAFRCVIGETAAVPPVQLTDFYLPLLNLDKLSFVRESYFSWFEFHLNSVAALFVTAVAYSVTVIALAVHWSMGLSWWNWATHLVLPIALFAGLGWFLVVAGLGNLRRYQEGFIWFLVGTLHFRPAA
jgi:hypothetical protein